MRRGVLRSVRRVIILNGRCIRVRLLRSGWKDDECLLTIDIGNGDHFASSSTGAVDFAKGRMLVSGLYAKGMLEISWAV